MQYALIMAGGAGTRLWPLSREKNPKQALTLVGERTMFQHAVERLAPLFAAEQILVVAPREHVEALHQQAAGIPYDNFIIEPEGRGTASAIGLAAVHLQKRDPEAVMAVLTADHYMEKKADFRTALAAAAQVAQDGYLVTLGIQPTYPATGYGYIQQAEEVGVVNGLRVHAVERFIEKPDQANAERMLASGQFSWNSGMFIWQVSRIMAEFERQMPALYDVLVNIQGTIGTPDYDEIMRAKWPAIKKETIDYGIMEGAQQVAVIPVDLGWVDIGSWGSLFGLLPEDASGNIKVGEALTLDTTGTLIFGGKRLIATIGLEDLIIVDTEDALLVCKRGQEQQVKEIVNQLKAKGRKELL